MTNVDVVVDDPLGGVCYNNLSVVSASIEHYCIRRGESAEVRVLNYYLPINV